MERISAGAPKRRLTGYAAGVRQGRILANLRDGWAHADIALQEGLTTRRVRQIVAKAMRQRPVGNGDSHLRMQMERLGPALQAAGAALARGDAKAIRPLLKVLELLDRYHTLVAAARPIAAAPRRDGGHGPEAPAAAPAREGEDKIFSPSIRRKPLTGEA
jgi:hypothetical protein